MHNRGARGGGAPRGGGARGGGGSRGNRGGGGGGRGGGSGAVYSPPGGVAAPDQVVTNTENSLIASPDIGNLGIRDTFPNRPGYGTKGRALTLFANYVVLTASRELVLYRYDIAVSPTATGKKMTQIVRLLLEAPELLPLKNDLVTDFKSTLISRRNFDDQTVTIQYRAEREDEPRTGATEYRVLVRFTNVLAAGDLTEYLTSTDLSCRYDQKLPTIQAFNIFLNHRSKSSDRLATIGSSKTFSLDNQSFQNSRDLGAGLAAIRGFFASVRAATARILVNVNVSYGAFYQECPLEELIQRFGYSGGALFKLEGFLKRLRVRTTHLKPKVNKSGQEIPRIKTIFGLSNTNDGHGLDHPPRVRKFGAGPKDVQFWLASTPTSTGKKKGGQGAKSKTQSAAGGGGTYISVYDFFLNTYGMQISRPDLPVINVGNRANPTYLPAQVCRVEPGQPANTKLNPNQTTEMIRFAVKQPSENVGFITQQGLQTAGLSPTTNPRLGEFGITVSPNLITVPGRVLDSPRVVYKQNTSAFIRAGGWNMVPQGSASLKFSAGGTMRTWSCLYVELLSAPPARTPLNAEGVRDVMAKLATIFKETGIIAGAPLAPQITRLRDTDDPALEELFRKASSSLQLLFVILPGGPIPLYHRIKRLGDVKYGIHTICSVCDKVFKRQDQYLRNLALKFNLKLGGNNHAVQWARPSLIAEDKTMLVGIDVTHPSPGSSSFAPSVAGMVASVDSQLGQWPAALSIQSERRQEMVSDLKNMLKRRLQLWEEKGKHASLPENILVYRDGVSEGQYQLVMEQEVPLLRAACKEMYPPADQAKGLPRMTVVIVGKRHHTRFYPTKLSDADRSGNNAPGTVVDRGVTEARNWDFFLQSHMALQGTARPAHYFVVLDEIFRRRHAANRTPGKQGVADELQELTQSLCYVFGRATKAVSICTPAYYADIVCERARCYLSKVFDSPSNSAAPSAAGSVRGDGGGTAVSQADVQIHPRLKDSMFYI